MQTLMLENTAPFQGLCELVADDEGLFAAEGLAIDWVDREEGVDRAHVEILSPDGLDPHSSHGKLFEAGGADMYNACEWGNYCRVQDSGIENGRQIGRRSIVTYAAIAVRPDSDVFTPQQLADRLVGVPFYFGTHYLALHMLEGFLPRRRIKLCSAPMGSRYRLASLMAGEIEATTLTEPYITLAEKKGCRVHGGVLSRHRGGIAPGRCRHLCPVQPRGPRGGPPDRRRQARHALLHRPPRPDRPRGRGARRGRSAREPDRGRRTGADPGA